MKNSLKLTTSIGKSINHLGGNFMLPNDPVLKSFVTKTIIIGAIVIAAIVIFAPHIFKN